MFEIEEAYTVIVLGRTANSWPFLIQRVWIVQVMQLRKACSHPYLFDGVEPEPFQEGEHIVEVP